MIDEQAPVYKYKTKLGLSKDEIAYNASIVNAHRMFLKSHDEMQAIKSQMLDRQQKEVKPMENLSERLDKMVSELKKELKDGQL